LPLNEVIFRKLQKNLQEFFIYLCNDSINRLKSIAQTTRSRIKRTYSLWLLLNYHIKSLTIDELSSYIPLIWEVDISNDKFFGIRQKIENEIKVRQDTKTILMLLELLKNDNPYLRFFGADLLNYFKNEIVIEPILNYLKLTTDDFMTKRQAICALGNYKDNKVIQYLQEEFERNRTNQDTFFRNNYLTTIEWILNK
jgi:hypothetical protein